MSFRRKLIVFGALSLIIAIGGFVVWRGVSITLRVAVPTDDSPALLRTFQLLSREMTAQTKWISFVRKPVAGPAEPSTLWLTIQPISQSCAATGLCRPTAR